MKDLVKKAVHRTSSDNVVNSHLDFRTEYEKFTRKIISCFMNMLTPTGTIIEVQKLYWESAVFKETKFHVSSMMVGSEDGEATLQLPLTRISSAASFIYRHRKKNQRLKIKKGTSISSGWSCKSPIPANVA